MKTLILFSLAVTVCLLTGCSSVMTKTRTMIPSKVSVDGAVEGRPSIGLPISIKGQRVVMLPFTLEHQKRWLEKTDAYAGSHSARNRSYAAYASRAHHGLRWHNVIFKHVDTGAEWLLLGTRGMVTGYQVVGPSETRGEETVFTPKALLFMVTNRDTNGDSVLTSGDASVLMAANPDGRNIREVSPADADCVSYQWDEETGFVYLQIRPDSNGDGLFTGLDESAPYRLDVAAAKAEPLTTPAIRSEADRLLR